MEPIVSETKIDRLSKVANTNVTAFRQGLEASGLNSKIDDEFQELLSMKKDFDNLSKALQQVKHGREVGKIKKSH